MEAPASNVVASQNDAHGEDHDYVDGSPHLSHAPLRKMVDDHLHSLVAETLRRQGTCHVLEIGGGHGTFSRTLLGAGASVTVTEASSASVQHLERTYAGRDDIRVFFDQSGEDVFDAGGEYDGVVCASLLHHIPDYLTFVRRLTGLVSDGGWFYSVQDPLFYPRRSRVSHWTSRGSYFLWRVGQGELRRGLGTRMRRLRGSYSETEASDLVEYHVVRQGVDEIALRDLLAGAFEEAALFTYWSTQSAWMQRVFARTSLRSDFGLKARSRVR